ncbi:centrosomal protein of 162 kDa isoform X2 [Cephus cinctus]|uniref:Centrosomal protein of 162 kDa n=1 Tax=Cephus cinctus TaxID=211228 RepID=A0AAJ7C0G2_CEPCN|nr:centrosomal protein of 162 kDa isoform X2 [Cephus cinctus]
MFQNGRNSPVLEDLLSTEEDTLGSSISLSVGENSIRIKEKSKPTKEPDHIAEEIEKERWWLKKVETRPGVADVKKLEVACKSEAEAKDKDDTLCDVLASVAFDKYPSDFENATDEDIGSILEEMSKIAGALSPNSGPDHTKSGSSGKNKTEEERSVEELLEEAEKLVKKNTHSLSKSASKSDTLVPNKNLDTTENLGRVRQLEEDIFQMIEEEVHKESEKIRRSPKYEKKKDINQSFEIIYENVNTLKPPKTLELQRKKFEEQKVEISSSSDLDDPIERHSKSEELKVATKVEANDNLQKEITDVDKDFFDDLLRKSKEKIEGGMSASSSFGQEDFSHFLKLLQDQSDRKEREPKEAMSSYNVITRHNQPGGSSNKGESETAFAKSPAFPEKEFSEILERELLKVDKKKEMHEIAESESSTSAGRSARSEGSIKRDASMSRNSSLDKSNKSDSGRKDNMLSSVEAVKSNESKESKVVNAKNELYTVGLTPRLELFADAIPKLIAEKSSENFKKQELDRIENEKDANRVTRTCVSDESKVQTDSKKLREDHKKMISTAGPSNMNFQKIGSDTARSDRIPVALDNKIGKKGIKFAKSKSYDHICKPITNLKLSLDDVKNIKSADIPKRTVPPAAKKSPLSKTRLQTKSVSKFTPTMKLSPKLRKDSPKENSAPCLAFGSRVTMTKSTDSILKHSLAGGDTRRNLTKNDWESLCHEERHKNALLKEQLNSEAKLYKTQIESMRTSFEEELFSLRKQNIVLKAKVDELTLNEKRSEYHVKSDTKTLKLERELEKQESLIRAYEVENKKLMQETKRLHDEGKNLQQKHKNVIMESNEFQKQADRIKDLQEEVLKLNLVIAELKEKNTDYLMRNEDLNQQNGLLKDELEMFKEQLCTKNSSVMERLQAMTTNELEMRKQIEDMKVELNSKKELLKSMKLDYERLQQNSLPLERELLELRVREGGLTEKLQVAKSHVEREKQLTQKLKDQVILDSKKIMDLNRQVREMERILKRKNPDSVSALILTANSEHERVSVEKVKLLEERIVSLENEIKAKENISQEKLADFQNKFTEMKERYLTQVMELEGKLLEATVKDRKVYNDMFTQTMLKHLENKGVETIRNQDKEKAPSVEKEEKKVTKVGPKSQNAKEDTHLIATIRGLKLELANKDKTVSKLTKEFQELQKTNRRLQKEREKLLNDKRNFKGVDADKLIANKVTGMDSRPASSKTTDSNDQNSNVYQNGNVANANQRLSSSTQRLYDPLQFSENSENATTKRLINENEILKEELNKMNKDFMALKNKRLHDLNLLQEEHEREMAALVKEYSVKFGDSKVVKLQGQINTQVAIISHLKQQIEKLRDNKEQVIVLKAEREHLENKVKTLNEKVKYLSTPGTEQLQLLQDKITVLQQRHESREMTLQSLVRDLLRTKTQCRDCKGERGKNKQLCYFRQELDHILGMLQELANVY